MAKKDGSDNLTPQQQHEQKLAQELKQAQDVQLGISPGQQQYSAQAAQVRQDSKDHAGRIAQPGPVERMVSYKDLFTERSRQALKQEREAHVLSEKNIAEGKVPTPIDKTITRLPDKSSGPDR